MWQPGCSPGAGQAETGHPWGQAGWLDQQSQRALGFSKTPFLIEECGSYPQSHPQPSPTSTNTYVHIHGLPHVQTHMQTYMLTVCTCQKGATHSRDNILIEFMRRAGERKLGASRAAKDSPTAAISLSFHPGGGHRRLADSQELPLGGFLSGPALPLALLLGSCYFAFPRRGHTWKSLFRKGRDHPFSLSLEDSERVRRDHQGRDCAPSLFPFS